MYCLSTLKIILVNIFEKCLRNVFYFKVVCPLIGCAAHKLSKQVSACLIRLSLTYLRIRCRFRVVIACTRYKSSSHYDLFVLFVVLIQRTFFNYTLLVKLYCLNLTTIIYCYAYITAFLLYKHLVYLTNGIHYVLSKIVMILVLLVIISTVNVLHTFKQYYLILPKCSIYTSLLFSIINLRLLMPVLIFRMLGCGSQLPVYVFISHTMLWIVICNTF